MENNAKDKKELKYPIPEILEEVLEGVAQITGKISYVDIFNTRVSKYSINKLMKYLRKLEIMKQQLKFKQNLQIILLKLLQNKFL